MSRLLRAEHDRGRLAGNQTASNVTAGDVPRVPPRALENPKALAAGWAVLLVRKDERVTRQVYLSLHSATKALERAKANGRQAQMVLVELVPATAAPIYLLGGDDQ